MKIIDWRYHGINSKFKEYKLGHVYEGDGYTFMVTQGEDDKYQLTDLENGKSFTNYRSCATLKQLYAENYCDGDREIDVELVIKGGVSR